ncbi:hypothetical protein [Micromonospora craterilacus]|uniref:hypothetical protein n=1 Tax=Micromonospora craterilacus TaxID=1655439 RepID=UPI0011B6EFA6|nr:hypothetical protein [Micromonospora craterilacus]
MWFNDLKNSKDEWQPYRQGTCWGEWTTATTPLCDKDFYEDSTFPNLGLSLECHSIAGLR